MSKTDCPITWRDNGVPVSVNFDDPYYSLDNGLAETKHVFLNGNGLPKRFCDSFFIAELGFGTGLNFLTTLQEWIRTKQTGTFKFTSFEAYPMTTIDMERAHKHFPEISKYAKMLSNAWDQICTGQSVIIGPAHLSVIIGDAREKLQQQNWLADCWYLDGFSPDKNPQLWEDDLMSQVGAHTKQDGTFATYTAAGFVRRSLISAGFEVEKIKGYGRKRHMTRGTKAPI